MMLETERNTSQTSFMVNAKGWTPWLCPNSKVLSNFNPRKSIDCMLYSMIIRNKKYSRCIYVTNHFVSYIISYYRCPHVYIYTCKIAILLLHNFEVPFTNGAGVQCVYLCSKVGIDRMDKVAKQLDKGHHVMKLRFTPTLKFKWNPKSKGSQMVAFPM